MDFNNKMLIKSRQIHQYDTSPNAHRQSLEHGIPQSSYGEKSKNERGHEKGGNGGYTEFFSWGSDDDGQLGHG